MRFGARTKEATIEWNHFKIRPNRINPDTSIRGMTGAEADIVDEKATGLSDLVGSLKFQVPKGEVGHWWKGYFMVLTQEHDCLVLINHT